MIAPAVAAEIRQLLNEGRLSQRKIAARLGVSRGTVNAIALGRRPDDPGRGVGPFPSPVGPPRRCPTCGGRVWMPCLLCYVRALRRQGR